MKWNRIYKNIILGLMTLTAIALFIVLYSDWERRTRGKGLTEDKNIYTRDNNIYDVYISIFPTENDAGDMLDLSAFSLHTSGNKDYNPVLDCNIQILKEGETPDVGGDIDSKNATIRVRGDTTRGDKYKNYKVKLENNAEPFFGQTNLNINKETQDVTKIATKLQTDLLADINNIFSYRTYFMRVWIRDASLPKEEQKFQYQGLYTEIEQPNKDYLKARGIGENTVMYKANNFAFAFSDVLRNTDDPMYDEDAFETVLGIQAGRDHKKLMEMLAAVNDMTLDFQETFQTYFDEENYLTWLAFNLLMGNEDTVSHNYLFFSSGNSKTWYFVPWDFDGALYFKQFVDTKQHPLSLKSIQGLNASILHRRYFQMDGSIEKLQKKMEELLAKWITKRRVAELAAPYRNVLEKTLSIPPDDGLAYMPLEELNLYLDHLHEGMITCYELYKENVLYPIPVFVAQPEKQEDGSLKFAWDPSYSYQGLPVTYKIEVYDDAMKEPVFEQENIEDTSWVLQEGLEPGIYFIRVSIMDSEGHEQTNLERFYGKIADGSTAEVRGWMEFVID